MSYQTVSDILAGSQNNYDFRKNDFGGAGASGGSSSFGELVSFYKNENNGDFRAFPGSLSNNVNNSDASEIGNRAEAAVENASDNVAAGKDNAENVREDRKAGRGADGGDRISSGKDDKSAAVEKTDEESAAGADKEGSVAGDEDCKKLENTKEKKNPKTESSSDKNSISDSKNNNAGYGAELGIGAVAVNKANNINNGKKVSSSASDANNQKGEKVAKLTNRDFARMQEIGSQGNGEKAAGKDDVKNKGKADSLRKLKSDEDVADKLNDEAAKKGGIQGQISNVLDNNGEKIGSSDKNNDDSDNLLNETEKVKSKGQFFMDKDKKISVEDLRTSVAEVSESDDNGQNDKAKFKVSEPKLVSENTANITMEMKQNVNANVLSSNGQAAAANGSNFQAMLNNQIQQSAPEFVKAGNLVLKDNNQGTINLILRPDELGNVKLHLSLDGKNISGHITVATKEALEVFKDNAETLREAFIKSGFESASFDVAYSGNSGAGQENGFQQQNDGKEFVAKKVYENHSDESGSEFDKIIEKNDKNKEYSINIVA